MHTLCTIELIQINDLQLPRARALVSLNRKFSASELTDINIEQKESMDQLNSRMLTLLEPIQNTVDTVEQIYQVMEGKRTSIRLRSLVHCLIIRIVGNKRQELLKWLSTVTFKSHHAFSRGRRQEGTGMWLLENEKFVKWRNSDDSSILWFRGNGTAALSSWR